MSEKEASGVKGALEAAGVVDRAVQAVKRRLSIKINEEFPGCLLDLCRSVAHAHAEHPAFIERGHTAESLLHFFCCECLRLLGEGSLKYIKVLGNPAAGTSDPFRLVVLHDNLRIDLTVAAFDRLIGPSGLRS